MGKLLKGGLSGGLILFIWSTLSWNVLGWQLSTFEQLPNDVSSSEFIQKIPSSGLYLLTPSTASNHADTEENNNDSIQSHQVLVSIQAEASSNAQSIQLIISLLTQISAALLITGLLLLKPHMQYTKRLFQVLLFATAAGIVTYIPYMNLFSFSLQYTLIALLNLFIGWLFASFAIAHFTRPNYPSFN